MGDLLATPGSLVATASDKTPLPHTNLKMPHHVKAAAGATFKKHNVNVIPRTTKAADAATHYDLKKPEKGAWSSGADYRFVRPPKTRNSVFDSPQPVAYLAPFVRKENVINGSVAVGKRVAENEDNAGKNDAGNVKDGGENGKA